MLELAIEGDYERLVKYILRGILLKNQTPFAPKPEKEKIRVSQTPWYKCGASIRSKYDLAVGSSVLHLAAKLGRHKVLGVVVYCSFVGMRVCLFACSFYACGFVSFFFLHNVFLGC